MLQYADTNWTVQLESPSEIPNWNVLFKPDVPDRQYRPKADRHDCQEDARTCSPTPFTTSYNVFITRPGGLGGHRHDDDRSVSDSLRPPSRK